MSQSYRETGTFPTCGTVSACSGLGLGATTYARQVQQGGTPGGAVTLNIGKSALDKVYIHFQSPVGDPGLSSWPSGTWTIRLNVTTPGNGNAVLNSIYICRMDNTCTPISTVGSLTGMAQVLTSTGVLTFNITGSAQASTNTGDTFYIVLAFQSPGGPDGLVAVTFDQNIDTPFGAAVAVGPRRRQYRPRYVHPTQLIGKTKRHPAFAAHTALQSPRIAKRRVFIPVLNRLPMPPMMRGLGKHRPFFKTGGIPPSRATPLHRMHCNAKRNRPPQILFRSKRRKNYLTGSASVRVTRRREACGPWEQPPPMRSMKKRRKFNNTGLQPMVQRRRKRVQRWPQPYGKIVRRHRLPGSGLSNIPIVTPRLRHFLRRTAAEALAGLMRQPGAAKSKRRRRLSTSDMPPKRRRYSYRSSPQMSPEAWNASPKRRRVPRQEIKVLRRRVVKARVVLYLRPGLHRARRLLPVALPVLKRRRTPQFKVRFDSPMRLRRHRVPGSGLSVIPGTRIAGHRLRFARNDWLRLASKKTTRRMRIRAIGSAAGSVVPGPYSVPAADIVPVGGAVAAMVAAE